MQLHHQARTRAPNHPDTQLSRWRGLLVVLGEVCGEALDLRLASIGRCALHNRSEGGLARSLGLLQGFLLGVLDQCHAGKVQRGRAVVRLPVLVGRHPRNERRIRLPVLGHVVEERWRGEVGELRVTGEITHGIDKLQVLEERLVVQGALGQAELDGVLVHQVHHAILGAVAPHDGAGAGLAPCDFGQRSCAVGVR